MPSQAPGAAVRDVPRVRPLGEAVGNAAGIAAPETLGGGGAPRRRRRSGAGAIAENRRRRIEDMKDLKNVIF